MTESKDQHESKKDAESAKASSSLEKVTDYHEETEVDTGKATAVSLKTQHDSLAFERVCARSVIPGGVQGSLK